MKKILICDCRETDCSRLCTELSNETENYFSVKLVSSRTELGEILLTFFPDVILCGTDFCKIKINELANEFPKIKDIPLICILRDKNPDVTAFCKASDIIFTPIDIHELIFRIEMRSNISEERTVFTNGDLAIDRHSCRVTVKNAEIHLTLFEYKLLCMLAGNLGKIMRYETILSMLWENPVGSEVAALRVYVNAIRKKLGRTDRGESYIRTHMGIGYCMPDFN